ncbi:hypothetical protein QYM36_015541 [Artemia franciscana]|uniref:Hexosyltransferase n=1 Tax=Artemia franciscana TaxID=6661 RepID=A0AA88KXG1_ARTSF|nr:hypothetical protein QYM36_015541 [Artemia franciscana]
MKMGSRFALVFFLWMHLSATFELSETALDQTRFLAEPLIDCDNIDFLIFVHSRPENFYVRKVIRSTWGGVFISSGKKFQTAFVVGNPEKQMKRLNSEYTEEVLNKLNLEIKQNKDILHLDKVDRYELLAMKHMASYKWINESCSKPKYFIKADDDLFMDLHHFTDYFTKNFNLEKAFYCHVQSDISPQREGKWEVTKQDYLEDKYPEFCSGLAYTTTLPVIQEVLHKSSSHKWIWVDDVLVTGIFGRNTKHYHLNLRYSFDFEDLHAWAVESTFKKYPFIFTHVDTSDEFWGRTVRKAWKKLEKIRKMVS